MATEHEQVRSLLSAITHSSEVQQRVMHMLAELQYGNGACVICLGLRWFRRYGVSHGLGDINQLHTFTDTTNVLLSLPALAQSSSSSMCRAVRSSNSSSRGTSGRSPSSSSVMALSLSCASAAGLYSGSLYNATLDRISGSSSSSYNMRERFYKPANPACARGTLVIYSMLTVNHN